MRSDKGSHHIWYNPSTGKVASVPDRGSRNLAPGTVRAILRELASAVRILALFGKQKSDFRAR
ncbi:MAG: type II toxin-antitoxin system HicA family toxin [Anaerolineae bacterium]|nr:type II toxin-antitoxin system HicA family toxin [Anaerolineae bacterium]